MKTTQGVKVNDSGMPKRMFPSFTLSSVDLPDLKDWKVGETYTLKVKVKQMSLGAGEMEYSDDKNSGKMHGRFQIVAVEAENGKENYEEEYAKKRSKSMA